MHLKGIPASCCSIKGATFYNWLPRRLNLSCGLRNVSSQLRNCGTSRKGTSASLWSSSPSYSRIMAKASNAYSTSSFQRSDSEDTPRPAPLKLLPRPLGIKEPPRWTRMKYEEKHTDFWDEKKIEQRTEVLMKLNHEAYYADVHKMNYHGGKRWIAPEQLVREDRALYFPDLVGSPLAKSPPPFTTESSERRKELLLERGPHIPTTDGRIHTAQIVRNHVSLIAITHSQISLEHVKAWTSELAEKWRGHERFRFIQVNLQQNTLRSLLVSLFASNLRKKSPRYFHQSYMVSYTNVDYFRDAIGLENKYVGYVYLVDWEGRIRWAGCGSPWGGDGSRPSGAKGAMTKQGDSQVAPEGGIGGQISEGLVNGLGEVGRLEVCTKVLMGRLDKLVAEGKVA